ncbi:baseplate multidomain protein megatron [Cypionkella psychrotolerans]|uniref:baseplate multidomain protein megatron n=1 Tax=Cypionkella psychrotolerans TaxID=1678131 RepID=UPI0006B40D0B|nr:glycoside hydrolase TIM-barrel-like domain-containing protein [Cypionkella psychrotolerans]
MATILLSAVGASLGAGFGGTVLGLSGAVIGRAIGATVGRVIDQKLLGAGSEAVDVGRVDRFRVMGASEGAAIPRIWGRVRVSGQVIWASRFQENVVHSGGGKGTPKPSSNSFSYSVSLAVALCEGEITRVGRMWADGNEIAPESLNLRIYNGDEAQLPDPKIESVEGSGLAPSYRGTAYLVIENLDLGKFGNRVPQFSFEVVRAAQSPAADSHPGLSKIIPGVCLIPGTGEYALATTPVHYSYGPGSNRSANVNSATGKTDFAASLEQLSEELPNANGVSLVVSWFGNDLRCSACLVQPKVEQKQYDGQPMPWKVSGLTRAVAPELPKLEGATVYGGTPADQSVVEAVKALNAAGKAITFYPFVLMDQLPGNTLPDPWSTATSQPVLPWRGRITLNHAPGQSGTTDRTAAAAAEVAAFFGTVAPADFTIAGESVTYSGPSEWSYRRFVLHYANLCKAAGGVSAFCIGTELRSLTQIRGTADSFPTVIALRQLAAEVKAILGPSTKITYAADWSEYFGYHTEDSLYFHLDPLWADPAIDFIGIDNYMPLSDWRDGDSHLDAHWGDIHNTDYLRANIAGGEGFDWYYATPTDQAAQIRTPITDGAYGEPWVYRHKDLRGWWSSSHHERIAGLRSATPTAWIAGSKPIRFTEYGCAAVDKATNQPNVFLDPKSSESALPKYSNGLRDDLLQLSYFQAMHSYWTDPQNNPEAFLYTGQMVDFANSMVWAWDARPFPTFPGNNSLWSDAPNYDKGHWLNGRASNEPLAAVIGDICDLTGMQAVDLSQARGIVRGYAISDVASARAALQPLILAFPTDVIEREGTLRFQSRTALNAQTLERETLAISTEIDGSIERTRSADIETPEHIRLTFNEAETDFAVSTVSASFADRTGDVVSQSELPLTLTASEANTIAERWMAETRVSRDSARFALPKSQLAIGVGDTVSIAGELYRIDRAELSELQTIEAVRVDPNVYEPAEISVPARGWVPFQAAVPVYPLFLDLPLLKGSEVEYAPHVCVAASPWPGDVAVWSAVTDDSYSLNTTLTQPAIIGTTETALIAAEPGLWDRGATLRVRVESGALSSVSELSVLSGANAAAIGDGSPENWELFQFASAILVAPKTYDISLRLRGQAGTDGLMPATWPIGSTFVLLNDAVQQINLPLSARGLPRYYRFGPADKGYDSNATVLLTESFDGAGLRPYAVSHLSATKQPSGDLDITWQRRTRIDGDTWQSLEVPLGEDTELYSTKITQGPATLRETTTSTSNWTYSVAMQTADAASGTITIAIAQVSQRYGSGPFQTITAAL